MEKKEEKTLWLKVSKQDGYLWEYILAPRRGFNPDDTDKYDYVFQGIVENGQEFYCFSCRNTQYMDNVVTLVKDKAIAKMIEYGNDLADMLKEEGVTEDVELALNTFKVNGDAVGWFGSRTYIIRN